MMTRKKHNIILKMIKVKDNKLPNRSLSIEDQLANALGRKDEAPNIALAAKIAKASDKSGVKELIGLLHKKAAIRHDAIKVLYEVGDLKPDLIIPFTKEFLALFNHSDNWMKWGAMSALYTISKVKPELIANHLSEVLDAMDSGSVITRDHGIYILCNVAQIKKQHNDCMELLLEQLEKAPVNQMPMYAEKTAEVISTSFIPKLEKILRSRKDVSEIPSKKKRIEKLLHKLNTP